MARTVTGQQCGQVGQGLLRLGRRPRQGRAPRHAGRPGRKRSATARPDYRSVYGQPRLVEAQLNDWPHPQVRVALGLLIEKPAPCKPSL